MMMRLLPWLSAIWLVPSCSPSQDSVTRTMNNTSVDYFDFNGPGDLDVLFMIDNSPGMAAKQRALAQNIPGFIQALDATGANYHIGITTSNVGSYTAPGVPWSRQLGSCDSFAGDDGMLQRDACTTRTGVTDQAVAACQALCTDPSFVPTDGSVFISKIEGVTNVPKDTATMPGQDIGPQRAFQCMSLVGDTGCGIEGQMEGAKRALDGHNPNNSGFLRPGSVLGIILVTDEDDCSVSLAGRKENDPVTMDCPSPDKNAAFNCFNPDYRCLARDVVCDQPTNTLGQKTNCQERDSSYLEPVATYVRFFQSLRPAGKLLVSGIWSPSIANGGKFLTIADGGPSTDQFNRGKGPDAACVNAGDQTIYGRPQVRLSNFLSQFKAQAHLESSVCDVDSYPQALDAIAGQLKDRLQAHCLSGVPVIAGDRPQCTVGDVMGTEAPTHPFPVCSANCCSAWASASAPSADDPGVMIACAGESTAACYCAVASSAGVCAGTAVLGVWRSGGGTSPPGTQVSARCTLR